MNKILVFITNLLVCIGFANAAVRDGTTISRDKGTKQTSVQTQSRTSSVVKRTSSPHTALIPRNIITNSRSAISGRTLTKTTTARTSKQSIVRPQKTITTRAATTPGESTKTGAEYEQCKNTYFSCMDQFCTLKNDDYRRCSCNNRVFALAEVRETLQQAGEQLTVFTENLDVVGMTAAQAKSMRTESEGETALTTDNSASKALLQAIMNSIRGDDSNVGGKYSDLNSINISFDTTNAFGTVDAGQAIATYNGDALYNAVYPQCRNAVRADCNDASLQRAITAYLMAIEQDCNTVQTAIEQTQKQMKSAVREGSAMLDLARIENRQKHNSSDITTCINEVETAILNEQVCGANYHKCLDNGEFIDITTGAPITGVQDFYKLEKMLTFSDGIEASQQKLAKNPSNRTFVQNFESRTKKFAQPALDKCVEKADIVWSEYLDKAMLDIYYAQRSKVSEIKQGCFEYISACYIDNDKALTSAMADLTEDKKISLQPGKITLNTQMCADYINSCNNMFDNNIIADFINTQQTTDTLAACRAVVKQCFDKYGGTNYENFYYPYSGLFEPDSKFAPDWFTLYDTDGVTLKSECAKQLQDIDACSAPETIEQAFGGFDAFYAKKSTDDDITSYTKTDEKTEAAIYLYGLATNDQISHRFTRPTGVATEVYNQIISILTTQCTNLQGQFIEIQFIKENTYNPDNLCTATFANNINDTSDPTDPTTTMAKVYNIGTNENMCPRDYNLSVATQSWGVCSCWENGARRSKWGKSAKCVAALPVAPIEIENEDGTKTPVLAEDIKCDSEGIKAPENDLNKTFSADSWCTQNEITNLNQVCPLGYTLTKDSENPNKTICQKGTSIMKEMPEGIE